MNKPVPPKEQPRQPSARPVTTPAAPTKAPVATTAPQAVDPKTRAPQVSRPKTIEPSAVSYEQIAVRAYQIWQENGEPGGTEMENWLEAERQLKARR